MSESERLQKISEILLDGAFIRENEIEMADTDLGAVLTDVAEKLQMRAEKAEVEITCDTAPVTVKGNETLLSMLFYNLTENAIKACSAGGKVKISCSKGQAIIEDNGKGMTKEQLLHITEPSTVPINPVPVPKAVQDLDLLSANRSSTPTVQRCALNPKSKRHENICLFYKLAISRR